MKKYLSVVLYILAVLGAVAYAALFSSASPFLRSGILAVICAFVYTAGVLGLNKKLVKTAFLVLFIMYAHLLISMLFLDSFFGRTSVSASVNLVPFKTVISFFKADVYSFAVNIIGNLVVFMPLALFLPLLFKNQQKLGVFVLTVTVTVAVVELMQYILACGACDIDDLLLNTIGAVTAYIILKPLFLKQLY